MAIMHGSPHPGEFIKETYLKPFGLSSRFLAKCLKVSPSTINRIIKKQSSVSVDMAYRLEATLGRSAESWLIMQAHYDLCTTKQPKLLKKIDFEHLQHAA